MNEVNNKTIFDTLDYVSVAEHVIISISKKTPNGYSIILTTSQIRKIMSLANDIYSDMISFGTSDSSKQDNLNDYLKERLLYLKLRCIYESGRDDGKTKSFSGVKDFIEKSKIPEYIDIIVGEENPKEVRNKFVRLFHYMEALVAYHRYYGGKDK